MPIPLFFQELTEMGCLAHEDLHHTSDGFYAAIRSLAEILAGKGVHTFLNEQGQERRCDKFFDDWFLYAVPWKGSHVYSLFKMREQEFDADAGTLADGDTPGVTISFIALDTKRIKDCLSDASFSNRKALNREINRVVAARGQKHDPALKAYFISPKAEGPYLVAELYVSRMASFAQNGYLLVPLHYAAIYQKSQRPGASRKSTRLPRFLDENNTAAGYTVCDHQMIYLSDANRLSIYEKQAILATHTANVSVHSFAAEVRYHARFLTWYARLTVPGMGRSIYSSAIRADMTIDDTELEGPAPFYRMNGRWVKLQKKYHKEG